MAVDKLVDSTQLNSDLTSVANAIRAKSGGSGTLAFPAGFVSEIGNIPTGGGAVTKKDVNFYDYDGTLVASKTKAEINAMSSDSDLPANPSHEGLTAQGWNWTVAQLKAQLTAMPNQSIDVGQMYVTTSGKTEIDVEFVDSARLSPTLTIAVDGEVSVDWGDNTTSDTVTGNSLTTRLGVGPHNYLTTGSYTIKITVISGSFTFYGDSTVYTILRKDTSGNENCVYSNCVKNIRLGNNITKISHGAFCYCYSLASVTMPSSITSIGNNAFQPCYSLISMTIPSGVKTIGSSTFSYCTSITNIAIPSSITSIGSSAFSYCVSLKNVTLPDGITSMNTYAFNCCYGFNSISIPSGMTSISAYTFYGCYNLRSITIPNTVTSISDYAFNSCYSLTDATIPNSVTSLGTNVFATCRCLTKITIPSEITEIGNNSFSNCYSLVTITIPSKVTTIGDTVFSGCYGAKEYHILPSTVPTLGANAFRNIPSDCIIYVPRSENQTVLNNYKTASNWSTYASYMQEEPAS